MTAEDAHEFTGRIDRRQGVGRCSRREGFRADCQEPSSNSRVEFGRVEKIPRQVGHGRQRRQDSGRNRLR